MQRKRRIIIHLLNLIGLILGIGTLYFLMIDINEQYALAFGVGAVIMIVISYLVQISQEKHVSVEETDVLKEEISRIDESGDLEDIKLKSPTPVEIESNLNIIDTSPESPRRVIQYKFSSEVYKDNIMLLQSELKNKFMYLDNEVYTYRLEALLKLGHLDKKIWEFEYEPIPFIGISRKGTHLIVNVGVDRDTLVPIGVLPEASHACFKNGNRPKLNAKLVSGSFRFISSVDHSFETYKEDPSIILTITY